MQYIGEVYSVTCEEAQIRIEAYSVSFVRRCFLTNGINRNQPVPI